MAKSIAIKKPKAVKAPKIPVDVTKKTKPTVEATPKNLKPKTKPFMRGTKMC